MIARSASEKASLYISLYTVFLNTFNYGLIFPVLPALVKQFGGNAQYAGFLASCFSLCQVLATPLLGHFSDEFGRRPVLLCALLGTMLSSVLCGIAESYSTLLLARCLSGFAGSTISVVNTMVVDIASTVEKPVFLSYVVAADAIGFMIGPTIGGFLGGMDFSLACIVSASLSFLNLVAAALFLPETGLKQKSTNTEWSKGSRTECEGGFNLPDVQAEFETEGQPLFHEGGSGAAPDVPEQLPAAAGDLATVPALTCRLYAAGSLLTCGWAALETVVPFYLMDTLVNDRVEAAQFFGFCFAVNGAVIFICSAVLYEQANKRLTPRILVSIGTCIRVLGFLAQGCAKSKMQFSFCMAVAAAGNQFVSPSIPSLLTDSCSPSVRGQLLAYYQSSRAASRIVASSLFGFAYTHFYHEFSFHACAGITAIAGALALNVMSCSPTHVTAERAACEQAVKFPV